MARPDNTDLIRILSRVLGALERSVDSLVDDIGGLRSAGVAQAQIAERVITDTRLGQGWIRNFTAESRDQNERFQQKIFQAAQQDVIIDATQQDDPLLFWNAVLSDSCPDCVNRHGRTKTLSEWQRLGLPGQGTTVCRHFCRCTLLPVKNAVDLYRAKSPAEATKKARTVVQQRRRELLAEEKRRGKPFAASTFNAKLGQARTRGIPLGFLPTE